MRFVREEPPPVVFMGFAKEYGTALECGAMGLCIMRPGHEGLHTTTVDRALALEAERAARVPAPADGLREAAIRLDAALVAMSHDEDSTSARAEVADALAALRDVLQRGSLKGWSGMTDEPRTEAGRALFARLWAVSEYADASRIIATVQGDIVAIEREAAERAARVPAPADGLREAILLIAEYIIVTDDEGMASTLEAKVRAALGEAPR